MLVEFGRILKLDLGLVILIEQLILAVLEGEGGN
jgi:hypothetical protein